jgi:hypothetical protein
MLAPTVVWAERECGARQLRNARKRRIVMRKTKGERGQRKRKNVDRKKTSVRGILVLVSHGPERNELQ